MVVNLYPCSGCGSRQCDGRCFMESAADYPELVEHQRINDTLAPVAHWEAIILLLAASFIGFILVAL